MSWGLLSVKRKSAAGLGQLMLPVEWSNCDFTMKAVAKELGTLSSPVGDESRPLRFFCMSLSFLVDVVSHWHL